MSGNNGDRSRFHRLRKQKLQNRLVRRALRATLVAEAAAKAASPGVVAPAVAKP